jgi:hypothetical protein
LCPIRQLGGLVNWHTFFRQNVSILHHITLFLNRVDTLPDSGYSRYSQVTIEGSSPSSSYSIYYTLRQHTMSTKSRRTPQMSTHFNNADNIERYLQEDGHRTWGFVIYRCTYESDDDWDQFMERLRYRIREVLEIYNGLDMIDNLSMTVIEDRSILDGASTLSASISSNGPPLHRSRSKERGRPSPSATGTACRWTMKR